MAISTAVPLEYLSRIIGYAITKGDFAETSPNLPMRIAVLGEVNTANQAGLSTDPVQITSAQQAGELFGFGSPQHIMFRILRNNSSVIGGIPTWAYPQEAAGSSTPRTMTITVTGTATANATHTLVVNGRTSLDGQTYEVNVVTGDTPTIVAGKIRDKINNVLGSPFSASAAVGVVTVVSRWTGLTSQKNNVVVQTGTVTAGMTYVVAQTVAGVGTPDIAGDLADFGSAWNTIVLNPYEATTVWDTLEAFNGVPNATGGTGQYKGIVMKPFIAVTGNIDDDPSAVTDARLSQVTIAIAPAPLSTGLPMEAAANMVELLARTMQDSPHLDVSGKSYRDMPTPTAIGSMGSYINRDAIMKKGSSTVSLVAGAYQIEDMVTTYHPVGEVPPQYRYVRDMLGIDWNVRYGYYLLEALYALDKALVADADQVTAQNTLKPKQWAGIVNNYADDLGRRALIADVPFTQASIKTGISSVNQNRLETHFKYKRTGTVRIASTTAEAGFNFGGV